MTRLLRITLLGLLIIAGVLTALIYSLTWRPAPKETLPVSCVAPRAPTLLPGQALKVMTWNVQYLAGKNY
ncbi:endonuclease/exonuclease/phosphatase family protein, partial [Pseudomonas sp. MAFF 301449]|nr:endonuclease/exonuclease/phosphatase family protein [Pseudomonas cyclaminis]